MKNNNNNCVWYWNYSLSLGALPKLFKSFENYSKFKIIQNFRIDCFCMNTFVPVFSSMFAVWSELCRSKRSKVFYRMVFLQKITKLLKRPTMKFACNSNENRTSSQVHLSCFCVIFNSAFLKNTSGWQLTYALNS